MATWPSIWRPSTRPQSRTGTRVAGSTWPWTPSQPASAWIASRKPPLRSVRAARARLPQVVASQVAALEPVGEQLADLGGRVGQGQHGLAEVARREQAEVAAQAARAAVWPADRGGLHPEQPQDGQGDGQTMAAPSATTLTRAPRPGGRRVTVALVGQPAGQLGGQDHAAVLAAGAADGHGQVLLAL